MPGINFWIKLDQNLRKREGGRMVHIVRQRKEQKDIKQMESFLEYGIRGQSLGNVCERCLLKKFKCVIIFMLTIITLTQLFITIFEKIDGQHLNTFLNYIRSKKLTFWPSLINKTESYVEE